MNVPKTIKGSDTAIYLSSNLLFFSVRFDVDVDGIIGCYFSQSSLEGIFHKYLEFDLALQRPDCVKIAKQTVLMLY